MSNSCKPCWYDPKKRSDDDVCPFPTLHWTASPVTKMRSLATTAWANRWLVCLGGATSMRCGRGQLMCSGLSTPGRGSRGAGQPRAASSNVCSSRSTESSSLAVSPRDDAVGDQALNGLFVVAQFGEELIGVFTVFWYVVSSPVVGAAQRDWRTGQCVAPKSGVL